MTHRIRGVIAGAALTLGGGYIATQGIEAFSDSIKGKSAAETAHDVSIVTQMKNPISNPQVIGEISSNNKDQYTNLSAGALGILMAAAGVAVVYDTVRRDEPDDKPAPK